MPFTDCHVHGSLVAVQYPDRQELILDSIGTFWANVALTSKKNGDVENLAEDEEVCGVRGPINACNVCMWK